MKNLDWASLSFGYMKTDYNVRCYYRDGKWGEIEVCSDEYLNLHMAATCLHYGQEAFEGLKAYRCPDGKVRIFRVDENAARLQSTCRGIMMPEVSTELFTEMVKKVVRLNQEWIPTYESGATLYIRPLLIGTSAQVGVHPAKEYCFLIFVTPVGPYFKGGFAANPYVIIRDYDRSAPLGTGKYKVGGNYAASLFANNLAHEKGYACEFYLDAKEKKYMDECGAANFFGIKDNTYITPKSTSILPSITNKSLMQVAEDLGMRWSAVLFLRKSSRPSRRLEHAEQPPSFHLFLISTISTQASATRLATSQAPFQRNCLTRSAVFSTEKLRTSTAGLLSLLSSSLSDDIRPAGRPTTYGRQD
jgi:branched-chain amino acid aminotransferase